jgi:hypothetical protein
MSHLKGKIKFIDAHPLFKKCIIMACIKINLIDRNIIAESCIVLSHQQKPYSHGSHLVSSSASYCSQEARRRAFVAYESLLWKHRRLRHAQKNQPNSRMRVNFSW